MKPKGTTILLTGVGGPTPRSIARSLKQHSTFGPYRIVGTDANPLAIGLYDRSLIDRSYVVPTANSKAYWEVVHNIVAEESIDVAVIQPEAEVEAWADYASSHDLPCPILLPSLELIRVCRDKALMSDMLAGTDFIPRTIRVNRAEDSFDAVGEQLGYPYWLRGTKGSSGLGSYKIKEAIDVKRWLAINPDIEEFVASEFLPGRNLACKLLYWNGKVVRSACGERVNYIMSKVSPSGITGNTSFGRLINSPQVVALATECMTYICEALQERAHGFFTVDLKEDGRGAPKVTEINVRHVAFTSAFAAAGANLAEDMVQLTLGNGDITPHHYEFRHPFVFLRDVDALPVVIQEAELLGK